MQKFKLKLSEVKQHHFFSGLLNYNSVVVDLGAHRGEFSSKLSESFGCKCYAVEALPSLYSQIEEDDLVKKFNYAITDSNKPISLNVSANPEGNSIYKEVADAASNWQMMNMPSAAVINDGYVNVNGITLETFLDMNEIEMIDLLKIDIEGAELDLFRSTKDETLCKKVRQITVEFHDFIEEFKEAKGSKFREIQERLTSLGFVSIVFSFGNYIDVLMINTSKVELSRIEKLYLSYVKNIYPIWHHKHRYIKRWLLQKVEKMSTK